MLFDDVIPPPLKWFDGFEMGRFGIPIPIPGPDIEIAMVPVLKLLLLLLLLGAPPRTGDFGRRASISV